MLLGSSRTPTLPGCGGNAPSAASGRLTAATSGELTSAFSALRGESVPELLVRASLEAGEVFAGAAYLTKFFEDDSLGQAKLGLQ